MAFDLKKINIQFRKAAEGIISMRWLFVVLLIVLVCVSFAGVRKVELTSSWDNWFFDDDPVLTAKREFEDVFGNSDGIAIHVQADDIFTPDILRMIRELSSELEHNIPYVDKVVSLTDFDFTKGTEEGLEIGELVPDPIPTDTESLEEIRRLAFSKRNLINKMFSDDSRETWVTVRLKEFPESFKEEQKRKGVEPIYSIGEEAHRILHQEKYRHYDLKEAGMPTVAFDKTNYFKKIMGRLIVTALIAALLILILLLRSAREVIIPFVSTASAIFISYGAMGFMGMKIDSTMFTVPVYLALAVSIGYSIHIGQFFKNRFHETGNRKDSVLYAMEHTGWPILFTALTTIGCMLAFNFTSITSIRWVGNASASMVGVVFLFVMILNPVLLSFGKNKEPAVPITKNGNDARIATAFFTRLGSITLNNAKAITIISCIAILVIGAGIKDVKVDFNPFTSFGMKVPYVKRLYDICQSKIGSMYSYNLTVELPEDGTAQEPAVLRKFENIESEISKLPLTKNTTSILDVLKDLNRTMHGDDDAYYRIPDNRALVSQLLLLYENSGGSEAEYWIDYDYKILRLQVSVNAFIAAEVEREIEVIKDIVKEDFPDAKMGMVGTFFEGALVNNYIARGQVKTFFVALLVIGLLMMIVFRSVKAGLVGLVPNILPALVMGGAMGYLNIPLDMMSMTVVPMLMGIAVDDSIHFVNHMKLEIEQGADYRSAVLMTFRTVGKALFMTTFILVGTFGMYATTPVSFFRNLGFLVVLGLATALVADYTLTPLLIVWTKPFKTSNQTCNKQIGEEHGYRKLSN